MAFNVGVRDSQDAFDVQPGETLLAAATRCGVKLPHACTLGGCGTCRVKVTEGRVRYVGLPMALSREEADQGYALACQAHAESDLVIDVPRMDFAQPMRQMAMVTDIAPLCDDVTRLQLVLPDLAMLSYRPGQHMNLTLPDGTHRSFSMASVPNANEVDFHIRRIRGGRFTEKLLGEMQPGDMVDVEIPLGTFRYHEEDYREILMVATGTGISPLKCILESLMDDPDCPPVSLYWGGRRAENLYLDAEIRTWAERLYEFKYHPVLSCADGQWPGHRGHVQEAVKRDIADLSQHSIYLCGSPAMIHDAKEVFLGMGASVEHLYADGFNFQHAP
jgi:2-polyprenylphenol hydroxylase and related flavodoxin oxidoreductases